ncbi:hypothetical protein RYX36_018782 [Vicia faba]
MDLPPNKRHRFIQQQQQHNSCSPLPTKKRKESRNSSLFHTPPPTSSPSIYSLSTKKMSLRPSTPISPPRYHPKRRCYPSTHRPQRRIQSRSPLTHPSRQTRHQQQR